MFIFLFALTAFSANHHTTQTFVSPKAKPTICVRDKNESQFSDFTKINMEQAIRFARQESEGGKLIESSLEKKDNYLVYRVSFSEPDQSRSTIIIDAGNGAFLEKQIWQP